MLLTLAVLVLPLSASTKEDPKKDDTNKLSFKEFSSVDGKFTILMPGTPTKKEQSVLGIKVVAFGVDVKNGAFAVTYADIPKDTPFDLSGAMNGITGSFAGKVLKETEWKFEGSVGKEFEAETTKPKGYISARLILINNCFYQIMAMGVNARMSNEPYYSSHRVHLRLEAQRKDPKDNDVEAWLDHALSRRSDAEKRFNDLMVAT
jgi:hypothetical protein